MKLFTQNRAELLDAIRTTIDDQTFNAYICGRTWTAWNVGTMSESDFLKFSDSHQFEGLVNDILDAVCGTPANDTCTCDSTKARPGGGVPMCLVCEAELDMRKTDGEFIADAKKWCEEIATLSDGEIVCKLADILAEKHELKTQLADAHKAPVELTCIGNRPFLYTS